MERNDALNAILAAAILSGAKKTKNENNNDNNGMKEVARLLYDAYTSFINVGFTEEQAFQLTLALRD